LIIVRFVLFVHLFAADVIKGKPTKRKAPNIGNGGAGVQDREQALPVKVSRTLKK